MTIVKCLSIDYRKTKCINLFLLWLCSELQ